MHDKLKGIFNFDTDIMQDVVSRLMIDIEEKKTAIIKYRLKQLNIEIDFELERKRLFKSIACVKNEGLYQDETYFYNDGSPNGRRIVTFTEERKSDIITEPMINLSLNYY